MVQGVIASRAIAARVIAVAERLAKAQSDAALGRGHESGLQAVLCRFETPPEIARKLRPEGGD